MGPVLGIKVVPARSIKPSDSAALTETAPAGRLSRRWLTGRGIGEGGVVGVFADVNTSGSLAELNRALAAELVRHRIRELDASVVRAAEPRALTQRISRYVFEAEAGSRSGRFAGIFYGADSVTRLTTMRSSKATIERQSGLGRRSR